MVRVIHRDIPLSLTAEGDIGPQELQAWDPGVTAPEGPPGGQEVCRPVLGWASQLSPITCHGCC